MKLFSGKFLLIAASLLLLTGSSAAYTAFEPVSAQCDAITSATPPVKPARTDSTRTKKQKQKKQKKTKKVTPKKANEI